MTDPDDDYYDDYIDEEEFKKMQALNEAETEEVKQMKKRLYTIRRNIRTASHIQDQFITSNTQARYGRRSKEG